MIILAVGVVSDLEDHGAQTSATPSNRAELLRVITLPVNQISLVKNLLNFFEADAVPLLDFQILA